MGKVRPQGRNRSVGRPVPYRVVPGWCFAHKRRLIVVMLLAGIGAVILWVAPWRPPSAPDGFAPEVSTQPAAEAVAPLPSLPVPASLRSPHEEIVKLQQGGDHAAALALYPPFLAALEKAWGADNPALAAYHYNHALVLKLAGDRRGAFETAAAALARWPGALDLQVLEATCRAEDALGHAGFDGRADTLLRAILAPENFPRLRGRGIEPAALAAQWGEMLLRGGRAVDALAAAEMGLESAPRHRLCRDLKARLLLLFQRAREALPLLEDLAAERPDPSLLLTLGKAYLESGDAAAAWERIAPLLTDLASQGAAQTGDPTRKNLRLLASRALNAMGRHREAAEAVAELLVAQPEEDEALHELASAARGSGLAAAAASLQARLREIQGREDFLRQERKARLAGFRSSALYYQALAELAVERSGTALSLIADAIALSPQILDLRLESARIRALLGRHDLAERDLEEAVRRTRSLLPVARTARSLALRGKAAEARRILERSAGPAAAPVANPGEEAGSLAASTDLAAQRALAFLELGEPQQARGLVPAAGATSTVEGDARLIQAELSLIEGHRGEAEEILAASFEHLPGGRAWAGALRTLLRLEIEDGAPADTLDPSDLLDHPRLFQGGGYLRHAATGEAATPGADAGAWRNRLRAAHARRTGLLAAMQGYADSDVVPKWREMLDLYTELGAARKAREVAWYIVWLRPASVEDHRRLASALSRPEESVARLSVIEKALSLAPRDPRLEVLRSEARTFLGLAAR